MTTEEVKQELEREPFQPIRLHLSSGKTIEIRYPHNAFIRQNRILVVHPIAPGTTEIGNYDVIALRLIERIEQAHNGRPARKRKRAS